MSFDQGEFSFDHPDGETGYRRWRERLDEQRRIFEQRWGVPLGHPVRLQLRGHDRPLTGRIEAIDIHYSNQFGLHPEPDIGALPSETIL